MKLLCIKDHVRSSINDFRERNRKPQFRGRSFELKKKEEEEEEEEEDDEQSAFSQFSENHRSCVFYGV